MDALYVLGTGSVWSNNELRYSLRSLERYALDLDRVFVVGEQPDFLKGVVAHSMPDPTSNKEYNIAAKILWACEHTDISDRFLFINDDHFLLRHAELETWPDYAEDTIEEHQLRYRFVEGYGRSVERTRRYLRAHDYGTAYFDVHAPIVYEKRAFARLKDVWEDSRQESHGLIVKSTYGNIVGLTPTHLRDCKLLSDAGSPAAITTAIHGAPCFSVCDDALGPSLVMALQGLYPQPSRFERSVQEVARMRAAA